MLENPIALAHLVPGIPIGLSRLVARALEKSPSTRIGSVRELAAELAPYGMPTNAIVVDAKAFSNRPHAPIIRESLRPELAERIKEEVDDFAKSTPPDNPRVRTDALPQFPNLTKLGLAVSSSSAPAPPQATSGYPASDGQQGLGSEVLTVRPPQMTALTPAAPPPLIPLATPSLPRVAVETGASAAASALLGRHVPR